MDFTLSGAAKFWVALLGMIATACLGIFATDSTAGKVCTAIAGICTALLVWRVPNDPQLPPGGDL